MRKYDGDDMEFELRGVSCSVGRLKMYLKMLQALVCCGSKHWVVRDACIHMYSCR